MQLQLAQPLLFFLQPFQLGLAHAAESAVENELHDLMQLAAIEKRAVPAAHIDDGAGQPAEVLAVHHLSALRAGAIADATRRRRRRSAGILQFHRLLRDRGLLLALRAQPVEGRRLNPGAVAARAFEQVDVADANPVHVAAARRAFRRVRLRFFRAAAGGPARRAERRALKQQRHAHRTPDRREARLAVQAAARVWRGGGAAARAPESGGACGHGR